MVYVDARVLCHMASHEQGCDRLSASSLRTFRKPIARYGLMCGSPSGSTLRHDVTRNDAIRRIVDAFQANCRCGSRS